MAKTRIFYDRGLGTELRDCPTRLMWVAVDKRRRIQATWYKGCVQPFAVWRKTCRSLDWTTFCTQVVVTW